jgi:hypothetical protein
MQSQNTNSTTRPLRWGWISLTWYIHAVTEYQLNHQTSQVRMEYFNPVTYMPPQNTNSTSRPHRWGWNTLTLLHTCRHRIPTQPADLTGEDGILIPVRSMQPYRGIQLKHQISRWGWNTLTLLDPCSHTVEYNWSTRSHTGEDGDKGLANKSRKQV